jgi:hypothetical protein
MLQYTLVLMLFAQKCNAAAGGPNSSVGGGEGGRGDANTHF